MNFSATDIKNYNQEIWELYVSLYENTEIFHHYITKNSELIAEIKLNLLEDFNKQYDKAKSKKESMEIEYDYSEIINKEHQGFKEINYKTMVLHIYTFLESTMRELYYVLYNEKIKLQACEKTNEKNLNVKKIYDLFKKEFAMKMDKVTNENYIEVVKYEVIRHAIAHNWSCEWNNPSLDKEKKELKRLIKSNPLLVFNSDSFIILNEQFLLNFLKLINEFLVQLFDVAQNKIQIKI